MNNTHIGAQVPSYVVNDGALNDNIRQDPLIPIGECFVDLKMGNRILRDRTIIIKNLSRDYIIGIAIQCANKMLIVFSTLGRHFILLNGKMNVQSVSLITTQPIIKCKSRTYLQAYAVTIISVKTPPNFDLQNLYECGGGLQLPEGGVTPKVQHKLDHKMPLELKIPLLNTNKFDVYITKNTSIMTLHETCEVQDICNIEWERRVDTRGRVPEVTCPESIRQNKDLVPPMPESNLQIDTNKKDYERIKMPEADVPDEAKRKLNTLLEGKYSDIVSKSATDIGRTNLIELDIPTEGPCVSCRPYSIPLKYRDFVDEEIQQLEDTGINLDPCLTGPAQS